MITVKIHSSLQGYFKGNKELKVACSDFYNLVSFLVNSFPEFNRLIKRIKSDTLDTDFFLLDSNKKRITLQEIEITSLKDDFYYLVPSLMGKGGKGSLFAFIGLGIGLIALAIIAAPAAGLTATAFSIGSLKVSYLSIVLFGAGLVLNGVMGLIQKPPKSDSPQYEGGDSKIENSSFSSLQNTTGVGIPVPINYGNIRVAGQLISGYLLTKNHGKGDIIKVSESFN